MKSLLTALLIGVLSGCATGYQREGFSGGYSEIQLNENMFQVVFHGNALTRPEKVADFTLLRCAELAFQSGFRYFVVVETRDQSKTATYTSPTTSRTTGSVESSENIYGTGVEAHGSVTTTTYKGQTYVITVPAATNTILCYKEKPQVGGVVYDAEILKVSIRGKYGITK